MKLKFVFKTQHRTPKLHQQDKNFAKILSLIGDFVCKECIATLKSDFKTNHVC